MFNQHNRFRQPLALLLSALTAFCLFAVCPATADSAPVYGDVNTDGAVNAADALQALQHSVKLITLEGAAFTAADVNGDGSVNAADALLILQHSVKLITVFPVEANDAAAADAVTALIAALPDPDSVTAGDAEAVAASRAAFDALSDAQQALIDPALVQKLADLENKLDREAADAAAADAVAAQITALPTADALTAADAEAVAAARAALDALSEAQQALVDPALAQKLEELEKKLAELDADAAAAAPVAAQITALPDVKEATVNDAQAVAAARAAFDALTVSQQALVDPALIQKLEALEAKLDAPALEEIDAAHLKASLLFDDGLTEPVGLASVSTGGETAVINGVTGKSLYVGPSGYLALSGLQLGMNDFSICFWLKANPMEGDPAIVSNKDWNYGGNPGFNLNWQSGGFHINTSDGKEARDDYVFDAPADYTVWNHLALVFDRAANTVAYYVNFERVATSAMSDAIKEFSFDTALPVVFGSDGTGGYSPTFSGQFDDILVYGSALSANDLDKMGRYYAVQPRPEESPELLKHVDGTRLLTGLTFEDGLSDLAQGQTLQTAGTPTYPAGYDGQGLYLDPASSLSLPDFAPGTGSFSVSCWLKVGEGTGGDPVIFGNKDWSSGNNPGFAYIHHGDSRTNIGNGSARDDFFYDKPADFFRWNHIVWVADREAGTVTLYVNFEKAAEDALRDELKAASFDSGLPFTFGNDGTGAYNSPFAGAFDDILVFDGALSAADVGRLGAYYRTLPPPQDDASQQVTPTPAVDAENGLSHYVDMNHLKAALFLNGDVTDLTGKTAPEAFGRTSYRTGVYGECLHVENVGCVAFKDFAPGTNSFSIAFWLQENVLTGDPAVVSNKDWNSGGNPGFNFNYQENQRRINVGNGNGVRDDFSFDVPALPTAWNHIVLVFDRMNNMVSYFVNFQLVAKVDMNAAFQNYSFDTGLPLVFGSDGTGGYRGFSGSFDDILLFDNALTPNNVADLGDYYGKKN